MARALVVVAMCFLPQVYALMSTQELMSSHKKLNEERKEIAKKETELTKELEGGRGVDKDGSVSFELARLRRRKVELDEREKELKAQGKDIARRSSILFPANTREQFLPEKEQHDFARRQQLAYKNEMESIAKDITQIEDKMSKSIPGEWEKLLARKDELEVYLDVLKGRSAQPQALPSDLQKKLTEKDLADAVEAKRQKRVQAQQKYKKANEEIQMKKELEANLDKRMEEVGAEVAVQAQAQKTHSMANLRKAEMARARKAKEALELPKRKAEKMARAKATEWKLESIDRMDMGRALERKAASQRQMGWFCNDQNNCRKPNDVRHVDPNSHTLKSMKRKQTVPSQVMADRYTKNHDLQAKAAAGLRHYKEKMRMQKAQKEAIELKKLDEAQAKAAQEEHQLAEAAEVKSHSEQRGEDL